MKPGKPLKRTELKRRTPLNRSAPPAKKGMKRGRGFAASKEQRAKVAGRACVRCGAMQDDYTAIDPAHLCARGMGGCDHPDCVIPLCRTFGGLGCHGLFDRGELPDLAANLEPAYRREVAHCVEHLGLYGTVRRLSPSDYNDRKAA